MLIGEVARLARLSKDGIRHYEELGLIRSTSRQAGSRTYRDYDPSVLETIEMVRGAQRLGLSLVEIGPLLKAYASGPTKEQSILFMQDRLKIIQGKISELREIEDFLVQKIARYRQST